MNSTAPSEHQQLQRAFRAQEALERWVNLKVGCILVITLMPVGSFLDYFVYPEHLLEFFMARLICSMMAILCLVALMTRSGTKWTNILSMVVPLLPVVFIAWMIAATEGFGSPYYAGLNLVLLAVGLLLRWTLRESVIAVLLAMGIYIVAGITCEGPVKAGVVFNNFYFIALMDLIVIVCTYFQYGQRFREFSLRYELDRNKKQLEESNQKLKELDQVKSRFFANISHELRTPLTLLLAPLETLLNRYRSQFDNPTRQLLVTMQSNGMRLLKLINDLLDLVRLESGVMQVKRESLDLSDFIGGLASAARQMADDKRITLETSVSEDLKQVMIDRDKTEKVILNLQFNALKFTPAGGRVSIRCTKEDDRIRLEIADTGMGISKKNLPHVFDRFWQADDSSRRKYQGVGIGLALVKEFIEIQEGTVKVDSEVGVGTTFTAFLPYIEGTEKPAPEPEASPANAGASAEPSSGAPDNAQPAPAEPPSNPAGTVSNQEWLSNLYRRAELFPSITSAQESVRPVETGRRTGGNHPKLLIADDEPDMLRFIKSQLEEHYQILESVDGQQAVDKAGQFLPDIILLDMMMPEKDGLQACREIRERTSTHNIPIILLTARADEETKLAALEAGASDFLPKPFSTTELHVRIRNLVELYKNQRTLSRQKQTLESTIEQLKETETMLVQNEKLASLGRMSAGIIHEINNPLNFASTGLFTLKKIGKSLNAEDQEEYAEILSDVSEGLDRVKTIVSDLRSFSHQEDQHLEEVAVQEVVTASLRFLSHEWKDQVKVKQDIPEDLHFTVNKNKMIQVLVNLLQNAIDSMGRKTFDGESPTLTLEGRREKGRSFLVVRDNGMGIKPEDIEKIFDPFFTTKDVGEGMGLGLSICYRIIESFAGQVAVDSKPGEFCEFTLDFPETTTATVPMKS